MNENDLARRIVGRLDHSLDELPASTTQKLEAARKAALARHGHAVADGGARAVAFGPGRGLRLGLSVAVVVAGLAGLLYWHMAPSHEDELEAGMLAGELPIHAYLDPGFDTWLRHTSHTPQQ